MSELDQLRDVVEAKRRATGIVIPVYLPPGTDADLGSTMVRTTVAAFVREVEDPACLCVTVDGRDAGEDLVRDLAEEYGVATSCSEVNRGKLSSLRAGIQILLEKRGLSYFAAVDQDGDHFANELGNFVRAARHTEKSVSTDNVLVLGRRISRHRPMGLLRGELEELADRVLLDALHYRAAKSESPLRLQFALTLDEFPDFHSGYKLYTRRAAEAVFGGSPRLCGVDESCYYRHACEAVMTVEAMESGAWLVVVNRSTLDDQPVTAFGQLNRQRLVADKIIWPCKRLAVPVDFVDQWMRNHMPRLLLVTLVPEGREELLGIRRLVLEAWGASDETGPEPLARPEFM